tara:strand:+ start:351 stop:620 length:270 start_codon:yes stop_codon:yes gene_type:complete
MSKRVKPKLDAKQAYELIAEVNASDRAHARQAVVSGIQSAQNQWIAAPVIAEALALELMVLVQSNQGDAEAAAYLRALARSIEAQGGLH